MGFWGRVTGVSSGKNVTGGSTGRSIRLSGIPWIATSGGKVARGDLCREKRAGGIAGAGHLRVMFRVAEQIPFRWDGLRRSGCCVVSTPGLR